MHMRPFSSKLISIILISVLSSLARTEDNPKELTLDLGKGIKLDLVLIPPGTFEMGTPEKEDGHKKSETLHTVTLTKPFYMGKYEVTQEQYEAIAAENPSKTKDLKLPVERVRICGRKIPRESRMIRAALCVP